jgi:hypothetical protein
MTSTASDSGPRIDEVELAAYRAMSPAEKMERVAALTEAAMQLAAAGIRLEHPSIDERELRLRLAVQRLGAETVRRVFGWSPPATGR